MNEVEEIQEDAYYAHFEFKGEEIKFPSKGRVALILSLMEVKSPGPFDIHIFIFGCKCPIHSLIKGRRDKEWFDTQVLKWVDETIQEGDLEEEARIAKEIMDKINATRATAIEGDGGSPSGN